MRRDGGNRRTQKKRRVVLRKRFSRKRLQPGPLVLAVVVTDNIARTKKGHFQTNGLQGVSNSCARFCYYFVYKYTCVYACAISLYGETIVNSSPFISSREVPSFIIYCLSLLLFFCLFCVIVVENQ